MSMYVGASTTYESFGVECIVRRLKKLGIKVSALQLYRKCHYLKYLFKLPI